VLSSLSSVSIFFTNNPTFSTVNVGTTASIPALTTSMYQPDSLTLTDFFNYCLKWCHYKSVALFLLVLGIAFKF
jgi:hypothetical protein